MRIIFAYGLKSMLWFNQWIRYNDNLLPTTTSDKMEYVFLQNGLHVFFVNAILSDSLWISSRYTPRFLYKASLQKTQEIHKHKNSFQWF